jgi:predicted dehydrogenase
MPDTTRARTQPRTRGSASRASSRTPDTERPREKRAGPSRYAVIGLGYIAQSAVLPAFAHARSNSKLAALVSGDDKKLKTLGRRYGVNTLVGYDDCEALLASGDIDALYVALPNTMHREFTTMAAGHGVHVLCEKPLAASSADCRAMIDACDRAGVMLMTAYRLHFEPANLAAIDVARSGTIGDPHLFVSTFSNPVQAPNIRLERDLGGGTLWDIGIYCINAARHLFQAEPIEAYAMAAHDPDERFREVEASMACVLRFPGERLASFTCSFGAGEEVVFEVLGTRGRAQFDKAYEISSEKTLTIGEGTRKRTRSFAKTDQFAPELLHFSSCIAEGRQPIPDGDEGLRDVVVIEALYRSAAAREPVQLQSCPAPRAFSSTQAIRRPPIRRVQLVNARPPGGR